MRKQRKNLVSLILIRKKEEEEDSERDGDRGKGGLGRGRKERNRSRKVEKSWKRKEENKLSLINKALKTRLLVSKYTFSHSA